MAQFIAFASASTNLVSGQSDSNGESDVFVFDQVAGTTALVSGVQAGRRHHDRQ